MKQSYLIAASMINIQNEKQIMIYVDFYYESFLSESFVNSSNEKIEFDHWFYVDGDEYTKSQEIDHNEEFMIY